LGFKEWFRDRVDKTLAVEYSIVRVTAVNKDSYIIRNEKADIPAEITGKLRYGAESPLDFPAVGDWVYAQYFDDSTFAIIHDLFPRKSILKRKAAGKKIDYQLIASNIDTAFIMQSLDVDFNIRRLERYLIMVNESNIKPVILLSKVDLISKDILKQRISEINNVQQENEIFIFSNITGEGLKEIEEYIKRGETYCLLGSSGVGKTTLLNSLIGEDVYATSTVREKDSKGKHKTSRRQLILLEQGGLIIDTPGMRELGNIEISEGMKEIFSDIIALTQDCHFNDCTHMNEPGCKVLEALEKGELDSKRYKSYLKLLRESEYNRMSYLKKRIKDREFGKMVKEVMKYKKK
ncbi:ribosome small subunit-dependent GTPase A, partial [Bacteroidota bacterium]